MLSQVFQIARIAVASGFVALLVVSILYTSFMSARRPGRLRGVRAVAFALGWLLFLTPFLSQFYYGPLTPSAPGPDSRYAQFDLIFLLGGLLILALPAPDLLARLFQNSGKAERRLAPRDAYVLGATVVYLGMSAASASYDDPLARTYSAATIQADPLWWFGLVVLLAGALVVALAERAMARSAPVPPAAPVPVRAEARTL